MAKRAIVSPNEAEAIIAGYFDGLIAYRPCKIDDELMMDENGHPIMQEIYINPPTIAGLCYELDIDKRTFAAWCSDEKSKYHYLAKKAKLRIEAYLEGKLITNRQADGVKFNLTNNFKESWKEKQEIELGEETRRSEALQAISLREKLELIITASEKARATMRRIEPDGENENGSRADDQD